MNSLEVWKIMVVISAVREGKRINLWHGKHKIYRYYHIMVSIYSSLADLRICNRT